MSLLIREAAMRGIYFSTAVATLFFLVIGCKDVKVKTSQEAKFDSLLLQIAKNYEAYGRSDNEYHWAPELCRLPNPCKPGFSESMDEQTHGRKLYSLFTNEPLLYHLWNSVNEKKAPVGMTIVKESWKPELLNERPQQMEIENKIVVDADGKQRLDHFLPYAESGGKWYKASKKHSLFIMTKLEESTEGTDQGWVYGTVTPDGKTVTTAGLLKSCMSCHCETKRDRLFGPQKDKPHP